MSSRRRRVFAAAAIVVGLGAGLLILEVVLRAVPGRLPVWYLRTLPAGGIELVTPGLLERTPIDGVPIPYGINQGREISTRAPSDLEELGVVSPADNPDHDRYPLTRFRVDRLGFLNPRDIDEADVLLVGDSFVVATGILEPVGLQARLESATKLTVFNLAVPAIGPLRERYLFEHVGLDLEPQAVIWFFFGGNDLADAVRVEEHRRKGLVNHADLYPGRRTPRSIALGLLTESIRSNPQTRVSKEPLPGFRFRGRDGTEPVWFHPAYLRRLARTREEIVDGPGWSATRTVLLDVSRTLKKRRIPLLVVYVPSKSQVYLPFVEKDRALVRRAGSFDRRLGRRPGALFQRAKAHRNDLDGLLRDFCREHRIAHRSLTPHLTRLAREGVLGYLAADTHWNEVGQAAALPVLRAWIEGLGERELASGSVVDAAEPMGK